MKSKEMNSQLEKLTEKERLLDMKIDKIIKLLEKISIQNPDPTPSKNYYSKIRKQYSSSNPCSKPTNSNEFSPKQVHKVKKYSKYSNNIYNRQMNQKLNKSTKAYSKTNALFSDQVMASGTIRLHPNYPINFDYNPNEPMEKNAILHGPTKLYYKNGDTKTIFPDGTIEIQHQKFKIIHFNNGDQQEEFPDGAIAYRYKENGAIEFEIPDHATYFLFNNGQRETLYPKGDRVVIYPSGEQIHFDSSGKVIKRSKSLMLRLKEKSSHLKKNKKVKNIKKKRHFPEKTKTNEI